MDGRHCNSRAAGEGKVVMTDDSLRTAEMTADSVFDDLLLILAWLDRAGHTEAAIHVNQALEILCPGDPRIALLCR